MIITVFSFLIILARPNCVALDVIMMKGILLMYIISTASDVAISLKHPIWWIIVFVKYNTQWSLAGHLAPECFLSAQCLPAQCLIW